MTRFALELAVPASPISAGIAASTFLWTADVAASTFNSTLGPLLGKLGNVPALNIDFARLAVGVYAADRSVPRKGEGSNWNSRRLELVIPVSDVTAWHAIASDLAGLLGFLSGDDWSLEFTLQPALTEETQLPVAQPRRVVLLSGGADSAIGALKSRTELDPDESHLLISHFSNSNLVPIQESIAAKIEGMAPGPGQHHEIINLSRRAKRIDGSDFGNEYSTRSRSLLFLALGLAAAAVHRVPLWIPENGFASLNPPLGPERRGSLSTRTTHPRFLETLQTLLRRVGADATIVNPFAVVTKGEMFRWVGQTYGEATASAFLSGTYSCSTTGQRSFGISTTIQCGVCFGCALRRASFGSSGVVDATLYVDPGHSDAVARWLTKSSVEPAIRHFVERGVRTRDLITLGLPDSYSIADAAELCRRGVEELRSTVA